MVLSNDRKPAGVASRAALAEAGKQKVRHSVGAHSWCLTIDVTCVEALSESPLNEHSRRS
jgi:hypothetical protein